MTETVPVKTRRKPGPKPRGGMEALATILLEYGSAGPAVRDVLIIVVKATPAEFDETAVRAIQRVAQAARALEHEDVRIALTTMEALDEHAEPTKE